MYQLCNRDPSFLCRHRTWELFHRSFHCALLRIGPSFRVRGIACRRGRSRWLFLLSSCTRFCTFGGTLLSSVCLGFSSGNSCLPLFSLLLLLSFVLFKLVFALLSKLLSLLNDSFLVACPAIVRNRLPTSRCSRRELDNGSS